jgi:uncharacterized protein DUF4062
MRIFVSSTFEDLREHRTAVDHILQRLEQQYQDIRVWSSSGADQTLESPRVTLLFLVLRRASPARRRRHG